MVDADEWSKVSLGQRGLEAVLVVTESGLYKLILRSDLDTAKPFQDWVTREVLPAIRKDGMYVMGKEKVKTGEMSEDEMVLLVMTRLQKKVERLAEEKAVLAEKNAAYDRTFNFITVDVFRGLKGAYWPYPMPMQMGKAATRISRQTVTTKISDVRYVIRAWGAMRYFF